MLKWKIKKNLFTKQLLVQLVNSGLAVVVVTIVGLWVTGLGVGLLLLLTGGLVGWNVSIGVLGPSAGPSKENPSTVNISSLSNIYKIDAKNYNLNWLINFYT